MKPLNKTKLTQMAEFIKEYMIANNGKTSSLTELMQATEMAKATAYRYLKELDRRGIVHYSGKNTLDVAGERYKRSTNIRLPLLRQIICGSPETEVPMYCPNCGHWNYGCKDSKERIRY